MIVTVSDICKVSCAYLGTHPSIFSLPRSASREIDQLTIDKEMRVVNDKIRHLHSNKGIYNTMLLNLLMLASILHCLPRSFRVKCKVITF